MSYQSVTLANLQAQLLARTEGSPWWTAEEARLAINESLRIWNAATGTWVTKIYIRTVPNDPFVALSESMTPATRVLFNKVPLEKCSMFDLDYGIPAWRGATTQTKGHPTRPSYWAPVSTMLFLIYPADAPVLADVATQPTVPALVTHNQLEISGVHATPILVNAGDFVDLGQEEHDVLLGYARHVLAFKMDEQAPTETYTQWIAFLKAAAEQNAQFAASSFYRRLLGLDAQRILRDQRIAVTTPVDTAVQQIVQDLSGR